MKTPIKFVTAAFVMLSTVAFGTVGAQASIINLQPIIFCDDDGTGCADTLPTGFTQYFETASDTIWAQGNLDFNFLGSVQIDDTDLNTGVDAESAADVGAILAAGAVVNSDAMILNIMFVENTFIGSIPGSTLFGFACDQCLGSTDIGVVINDVIFGNEALGTRLDTISHEIGHILGLGHNDFGAGGAVNLMTSGSVRTPAATIGDIAPNGANLDQLTAAQLTQALSDVRYVKVPEPGSLALFVTGLLMIFLMFGRARSARAVA